MVFVYKIPFATEAFPEFRTYSLHFEQNVCLIVSEFGFLSPFETMKRHG